MQTLSRQQQLALISLQGLANRSAARIYLYNGYVNGDNDWLAQKIYSQNSSFQKAAVYTDFQKMISDFKTVANVQGVVIWDPTRPFTLNIATNLAGVANLIMITPDMKRIASQLGLPIAYDLTTLFTESSDLATNMYNAEAWVYNTFASQYGQQWLANYYFYTANDMERDFVIQNKVHVFWVPGSQGNSASGNTDSEYSANLTNLIGYVLQHFPMNTPVIGWPAEADPQGVVHGLGEFNGVHWMGQYGKYTVGSDWATNYSFHSQMGSNLQVLAQTQVRTKSKHTYDPSKKYVALMIFDSGDAPCWFQYFFRTANWSDPDRGQVPVSYSISPQMQKLMPSLNSYLYQTATQNDYFFSSVSGLGYSYPLEGYGQYGVMAPQTANITGNQAQIMTDYYQKTLSAMQVMDLDIMAMYSSNQTWDSINNENLINTQMAPYLTGISAIITDLGRLPGMVPSASSGLIANKISLYHTLTRWPGYGTSDDYSSWTLAQNPNSDLATLNAAHDQDAVSWLVNEIQQNSQGSQFLPVMAYSWMYGPHRLNLVRQQLESQGYIFVTLNEFNELWRQSKPTLPAANPDPWNRNGMSARTLDDVEVSVARNVFASGVWNDDTSGAYAPAKAVDGDTSTYWASNNDGTATWLTIDLGDLRLLSKASILWQAGGTYQIQVSTDGVNFLQVATGNAGSNAWTVDGFASPWWARWVRILPTQTSDPQYRAIFHIDLRE